MKGGPALRGNCLNHDVVCYYGCDTITIRTAEQNAGATVANGLLECLGQIFLEKRLQFSFPLLVNSRHAPTTAATGIALAWPQSCNNDDETKRRRNNKVDRITFGLWSFACFDAFCETLWYGTAPVL